MMIGKIILENGTEVEFGLGGWTSTDAVLADYLNLMFGKETYHPQDGTFGVRIIHLAAQKLGAKQEIYPRQSAESAAAGIVAGKAADDDDEDAFGEDPWIEKANTFLDTLES